MGATAGCLQRDERVGGRTRLFLSAPLVPLCTKFISTASSNLTITIAPRQTTIYTKVERMVYLLDRSDFELGRDFCAAQDVVGLDLTALIDTGKERGRSGASPRPRSSQDSVPEGLAILSTGRLSLGKANTAIDNALAQMKAVCNCLCL